MDDFEISNTVILHASVIMESCNASRWYYEKIRTSKMVMCS